MRRCPRNPILTRDDIPDLLPSLVDATSVFNPGAIKVDGKYVLMLRVQSRSRETHFLVAESKNGIDFKVRDELVHFRGIDRVRPVIYHCYDARITKLDGVSYIMFAMDMDRGCRLGIGKTIDFRDFEFMGVASSRDMRNGVVFPEKVDGKYLRLDRPNRLKREGEAASGSKICVSQSRDLIHWKTVAPIMSGRFHYWDELIGPGPPPVKTRDGWLSVYHGVATHFGSANIYQGGVFLMDLKDPSRVIARGRYNILEPREPYELIGQVPNVCFPSGMIVEDYDRQGFAEGDSKVFIYYGAAETAVGLLMTTIRELVEAARMS